MSCSVGPRHGLDPMLLWLWRRPAATAPIGPQAWESLCATGVAIEKTKRQKKKQKTKKKECLVQQFLTLSANWNYLETPKELPICAFYQFN